MYVYFNVYGEPARGIEPTENRELAIRNGKMFELVVFDTDTEMDIYDPRKRG